MGQEYEENEQQIQCSVKSDQLLLKDNLSHEEKSGAHLFSLCAPGKIYVQLECLLIMTTRLVTLQEPLLKIHNNSLASTLISVNLAITFSTFFHMHLKILIL